ncbi:MAG: hypothetical protein QF464_13385, partial [Myxococcota bacterium]|nr:hypothetical protein [Myxococcota bacterium]
MSDTDNPTDEHPEGEEGAGGGAADLKARLGLRTRKRRSTRPTGSSLGAGAEVADARRRAEAASGDAGVPEEAFQAFANDKTPLPQALPGAGDDLDLAAGPGRVAVKPLIVAMLAVAAVALFLGNVLGGSLEQQGLRDGHASLTKTKLEAFSGAKTKTGADLIEALTAFQGALKKASKALEGAKVAKTDGEKIRTETLKTIMTEIKGFVNEGVFIDPKRLMDDIMVLYKHDELLEALKFAVKTRHLHDLATAAVAEDVAYARMAAGPFLKARLRAGGKGGASKGVLVRRTEREVPELGKIPAAVGAWILDTGKPSKTKIKKVSASGKKLGETEQWQMMVVETGKTADDAVQVPTSDVMT